MKVLILSCKTGQGHHAVANAIAETLDDRGFECEVIDALSFVSDRMARFVSWGHSFIYCHCPGVFTAGYEVAERHPSTLGEKSLSYRFFSRGSQALYEYWLEGQFDTIICTHVFASLMLTDAKNNYPLKCRSYFVATDYASYPGVQDSQVDVFFIPDDSLKGEYGNKCTVTSGIPVFQKFFHAPSKEEAIRELGLPEGTRHVLMMCGSMGCGPIEKTAEKIVAKLDENCVMSIVCGTNERLHQRLTKQFQDEPRVRVLGFVRNIDQLMAASDVYVTKPGGISTTEAMVVGVPMALVDAVAGCEDHNMKYFCDMGVALAAKEPEMIAKNCMDILSDAEGRSNMIAKLEQNRKNGAVVICDYLQEHA